MPTWYNPAEIIYSPDQILWLSPVMYSLRDGDYPDDPHESIKNKATAISGAYYETAINIYAELERRLNCCGIDGQIFKALYCWRESEESLGRIYNIPVHEVKQRAEAVLWFCSGSEWREHKYNRWVAYRAIKNNATMG